MTVGLQLTDGVSTVDLNDGAYNSIIELDIGSGDVSAQTVSGSVRIFIDGTKAQIQGEIAAIQKLLQEAVDYSGQGQGNALHSSKDQPVYINYRTDSSENYYRSQLFKASWAIDPGSIEVLNFDCGGIVFIIDFERWNWWEGAEVQVQLSTLTQAATTNAVTVYNPYNGSGNVENWVQIDSAQCTGDAPAATRIEMTNTYSGSDLQYVWIGQNFVNPLSFPTILPLGTPSTAVNITVPSGAETSLANWTLSDAMISAAAGRYFKFMPAFKTGLLGNNNYRYRIKFTDSLLFWMSSYVKLDASIDVGIRDMFTIAIPPALAGLANLKGFDLEFTVYQETGSTGVISIDYAHLMPVDGYMYVFSRSTAQNERIVLDGFSRIAYQDNGSGLIRQPYINTSAGPIMLQADRTQRIYFAQHTNVGSSFANDETLEIKIYTRPRRLSI